MISLNRETFLGENLEFLVDTGSQLNLAKVGTFSQNTPINERKIFNLIGIGKGATKTLGEVEIHIKGEITRFQIIPEKFQILQRGILGVEFLRSQEATLKFKRKSNGELIIGGITIPFAPHTIRLPGRQKTLVSLPIKKTNLKTGYIRRIQAGPGIYIGESLVTPKNELVQLFVVNSNSENIELTLPPVELEDYDLVDLKRSSLNESDRFSEQEVAHAKRLCDIVKLLNLEKLNDEEKTSLLQIINAFPYQFHLPTDKLGCTSVVAHKIITTDEKAVYVRQYRQPQIHKEEIKNHVKKLLENDAIQPSNSPYNSPTCIVPKKPDAQGIVKTRMVIDYRGLNQKTIGDAYPLPNICDILDQLGGAKYFSTLDLASGFHQIPMDQDSQAKTAFSTPYGHYEFKRMPFGLKNAPSTFQRLMDQILSGLQGNELFVYMDDIVVYASSLEEHSVKLKKLLGRLKTANLTLQPEKCHFLGKEITYLGHVITQNGVKPDPRKIEAVKNFPLPKTRKNIKQFLGLIGYYRRFIPDFAKLAKPLTFLTKLGVKYIWGQPQQKAFEELRDIILQDPILQYPDFSKPFLVTTDASDYAVGAILSQGKIGEDLPVAYASRTLNDAETRYATIEKELLAILFGIENFRPYLYGQKFTLVTDHRPLVWLHNIKTPGSKINRWRLRLGEYDYVIVYKPGKINSNADALSRNPVDKEFVNMNESAKTEVPHKAPLTPTDYNQNNDSINDTFTLKDPEQIRAINSNVSALDLSHENNTLDRDYLSNYQLIQKAFNTPERENPSPNVQFTNPPLQRAFQIQEQACEDSDVGSDLYDTAEDNEYSSSFSGTQILRSSPKKAETSLFLQQDIGGEKIRASWEKRGLSCSGSSEQGLVMSGDKPGYYEGRHSHLGEQSLASRVLSGDKPDNDRNLNGQSAVINRLPAEPEGERGSAEHILNRVSLHKESSKDTNYLQELKRRKFLLTNSKSTPQNPYCVLALENSCIHYKKDLFESRKDHLIHFTSEDCKFTTQVSRNLEREGLVNFEALHSTQPQKGQTVTFEQGDRYVFHLVVKSTYDEKPHLSTLKLCLSALKDAVETLGANSCSISRKGNGLDQLSWPGIEAAIREAFGGTGVTINICTNELLVPDLNDRQRIIEECHSSVTGGHLGIAKTYHRLRNRFFWDGAKQEVQQYVKSCESCQRRKLQRQKGKEPMKITDTPRKAFDKIQIDIVGPLPITENGNRYILTVQDCLTKYSDAIPLKTIDSVTIAVALAENVICRFGCPRIIHTDQGSNFLSQIMKNFCRIFNIKQIKSTAFHPQSLGALERSHHVFVEYLRHYCSHYNWDQWLKFAMFSFNSTVHSATKFTPHKLVFGEDPRIPSEFETGEVSITYNEYLDNLLFKIYEAQANARENILQAKLRYKYYYDKKSNPETYEIGEHVYLLKEPRTSKLDDHYEGPYKITNVFNDHNVEIAITQNKRKIVHKNKLKLAHLRANLETLE